MAIKDRIAPGMLRQVLRYEPETGKLYWLPRPASLFNAPPARLAHICESWNAQYAGGEVAPVPDKWGYISTTVFQVKCKAHRLAWALHYGEWPSTQIDHINGVRSDNRIANLRVATPSQNNQNMKKRIDNKSGAVGVCWHPRTKRWRATIVVNKKQISLGYFRDKDAAIVARQAASVEHGFHVNHGRLA